MAIVLTARREIVLFLKERNGMTRMKSGFKIMDSDMHLREPADLWDKYMEPEWRERAPRVLSSTARSSAMVMIEGKILQGYQPTYRGGIFDATRIDQEIAEYRAIDVIQTFSALNDVTLISQGGAEGDSWWGWRWRWERGNHLIEWDFSALNPDEPSDSVYWGGSNLTTLCTFANLVRLWNTVRAHYPAVWLHDGEDTRMYTPHSFLEAFALPTLQPALSHQDATVRARAEQELATYRILGL